MMAICFNALMSLFFLLAISFSAQTSVFSFTVDLIHRDSPQSPFYNPSTTDWVRLNDAFHRSVSRSSLISKLLSSKSANDIQSQISASSGDYLMKLSVGTPSVPVVVVVDTGSDLSWIQCTPCTECYPQDSPIFDPKKSSTYKQVPCDPEACSIVDHSMCNSTMRTCSYEVKYGDGSYTKGDVAVETFTFGSTSGKEISIPELVYGCGHSNKGIFRKNSDGLVGLGRGNESIIRQLEKTIGGNFSYCLVPYGSGPNVTSKINFGNSTIMAGPGVISTPIYTEPGDSFYHLVLNSISIGGKSIKHQDESPNGDTKIIIDSGTTYTFLPRDYYGFLELTLKFFIKATPIADPQGFFSLCYSSKEKITFPELSFNFVGAELKVPATNVFGRRNPDLICLTIIPTDGIPIIGNIFQNNFLIGHDLVKNVLSFKPTDCTKY